MTHDSNGKGYLEQIQKINQKINQKITTIEVLKEERDCISVILKEKVQTSGINDFGDMSARVIDLEGEVENLLKKRTQLKMEILTQIKRLEHDDEVVVLIKKYLQEKTLAAIAKEEHWSYSKVKKLHGTGLKNFRERDKTSES